MIMYKNINTGEVISEKELKDMHLKEYANWWDNKTDDLIDEFKSKEEYIQYMIKNDIDTDFIEIEE